MATSTKDFYKILGVAEKATSDEIKKAYRKLAKKYHPDHNAGDEKAAERFKEVGEAYAVLSDAAKRKKYDQMRRLGAFGIGDRAGGTRTRSSTNRPGDGGFSLDDLGGLGDIFSSIFDRSRKGPSAARKQKGKNVETTVSVSFKQAISGGKITVSVPITEECATCGGDGAAPGTPVSRCTECGGSGTVSFGQGGFAVNRPCPACMGRGTIPDQPCPACKGAGSVRQNRTIQVSIPEGVETGSRIRLTGQGERGSAGGPPGDLIITFKVKDDPFFKRDGQDVIVEIPINLAQALLGSKMQVRTIHGSKLTMRIPPGTQPGKRFRVPGQGVEKGGKKGDMIVEVRLNLPEELTSEQRELVEKLAQSAELRY